MYFLVVAALELIHIFGKGRVLSPAKNETERFQKPPEDLRVLTHVLEMLNVAIYIVNILAKDNFFRIQKIFFLKFVPKVVDKVALSLKGCFGAFFFSLSFPLSLVF